MCILLVEDDPLLREILAAYFEDEGFPHLIVETSDEAASLIDHPPKELSVLVTDFNLPGSWNGCQVADHMVATHPHVHVFIITGRPDLARQACGGSLSRYAFLDKPFRLEALRRLIEDLIRH
jgi:DNA-binding NtrC family response regulator